MDNIILNRIKNKLTNLPNRSGVYRMLDENGVVIYVGKAKNLKNRVSSYFNNSPKMERTKSMVSKVFDFEYIITDSELEALNLESSLIHKNQPFYNVLLKDGKAFPYIKIDINKDFPKAEIVRSIKNDKALYFGPYFSKISATELLKIINETFRLRDCGYNITENKLLKKECLNFQINNCLAPCTKKVTKQEYHSEVEKVINFLKGDFKEAKERLIEKMKNFANVEQFEKAIFYKNMLSRINYLNSLNVIELNKKVDIDVIGMFCNESVVVATILVIRAGLMVGASNYNIFDASLEQKDILNNFIMQYYLSQGYVPSEVICSLSDNLYLQTSLQSMCGHKVLINNAKIGIKKKLLEMAEVNAEEFVKNSIEKTTLQNLKTEGAISELKKELNLSKVPYRIEGYDISNLTGTNIVASMVVFENGIPNNKHYRKFKIDLPNQNDFESMHQVLLRRCKELSGNDLSFKNIPDLILIDGGAVQLEFAKKSLSECGLNIDIISLAKGNEEIYVSSTNIIKLPRSNFGLKLLQNVRDESHRFAITFQRNTRNKKTLTSSLENIEGLGKDKIKELFLHFKSLPAIKCASVKELKIVNGVGEKLANNIYNYFHNPK